MPGAGLEKGAVPSERIGAFAGCGVGGAAALEAAYRNGGRVPLLTVPAFMPNAPAAQCGRRRGARRNLGRCACGPARELDRCAARPSPGRSRCAGRLWVTVLTIDRRRSP
ncbi:MAG: hypothetical protein ACRYGA_04975 [Janthinobacterium lividum]